ncbi:hypothetical protein EGT71_19835 [Atlantibacter subterranea]|uniref:Uncharacterized protein n=1 Tax=Atlantibacter subterraneus TaxID=255519 RepID=A0A3R9FPZ7_9ENTR|nr:hypothetical protein FR762_05960 [Enterobacter sp. E76]RSB60017.1 hypothetical protein EGK67_18275 [Atlantibacter subterranea]RSE02142.1 hypothetical protein EGT84_19750 [Atlantibacter subterranea]RSE22647.1 hypothetical protein EGT71_19835 [Atlantibacter subterranea]TSJ50342.1 hypothetical protein FND52_20280 [Atlantibacter subterranea]
MPSHDCSKHTILTANSVLLNLYAKKFRCPDVLTSISSVVTLWADFEPIPDYPAKRPGSVLQPGSRST